jgi:DNA-binding transcriptional regulator YdaS (Cro superfamily)
MFLKAIAAHVEILTVSVQFLRILGSSIACCLIGAQGISVKQKYLLTSLQADWYSVCMSKKSLLKAVELIDGQVALATAICALVPDCKVRQGHVWNWLNMNKEAVPPAEYVIHIAQAVSWRITPHELRPDLYPHPSDGMPKSQIAMPAVFRQRRRGGCHVPTKEAA